MQIAYHNENSKEKSTHIYQQDTVSTFRSISVYLSRIRQSLELQHPMRAVTINHNGNNYEQVRAPLPDRSQDLF